MTRKSNIFQLPKTDLFQKIAEEFGPEKIQEAMLYVTSLVLSEVEEGLSGRDATPAFLAINKIYQEYQKGCYFCNGGIDGNETEFNPDTQICLICQVKLANVLAAYGCPGIERKIQTWRLTEIEEV
jgi:hypothetical protein